MLTDLIARAWGCTRKDAKILLWVFGLLGGAILFILFANRMGFF